MIDRLYPGRWPQIRAPSRAEMAATHVLRLKLTEASAKLISTVNDLLNTLMNIQI